MTTGVPGSAVARGLLARFFRGPAAPGLAAVLERLAAAPPRAFAALTYHRVDEPGERPWLNPSVLSATPAMFEEQMTALLRRNRPIGLPELLAARRLGRGLPPRAVLVTFDDAYRDFLDNAWPILSRLGIPATLFVPTGYPDAARSFWWDELWDAIRTARRGAYETPLGPLELTDESSRWAAVRALVEHHKGLPHDDAVASIDDLARRLDGKSRRGSDVLGWEELRRLASAGLHVAAHTRTHPLLTRLEPHRVAAELAGMRDDLARHLGQLAFPTVFAYPGGQHSAATRAALADAGFDLALTTERGINEVGRTDPLRLRRINVGLRSGPDLIRAQLAFFTLRYRARRV